MVPPIVQPPRSGTTLHLTWWQALLLRTPSESSGSGDSRILTFQETKSRHNLPHKTKAVRTIAAPAIHVQYTSQTTHSHTYIHNRFSLM